MKLVPVAGKEKVTWTQRWSDAAALSPAEFSVPALEYWAPQTEELNTNPVTMQAVVPLGVRLIRLVAGST